MGAKYNFEEVKSIFEQQGLFLLTNVYRGVFTPMPCIDKQGYKYKRSLATILHNKRMPKKTNFQNIFSTKNPFCWYNINHYMETETPNQTKLISSQSDYTDNNSQLLFVCGVCGKTFRKRFAEFKRLEHKMCVGCYKEHIQEHPNKKRTDLQSYKAKAEQLGMIILNQEAVTVKGKLEVQDKQGYKGFVVAAQMLYHNSKFERYSMKNPYTLYNIKNYIKLNNLHCQVLDQPFQGDKAMMRFVCECGEEFQTSLTHFLHDGKTRCNKCRIRQSNIAFLVERYFIENNIPYEKEKRFVNCVGDTGLPLPFDFYAVEKGCCIEVDGIQHYKPITFGATKERAQQNFEKTKHRDALKNQFCEQNHIPLLRIPFWRVENSTDYISDLNRIFFPSKCSEL